MKKKRFRVNRISEFLDWYPYSRRTPQFQLFLSLLADICPDLDDIEKFRDNQRGEGEITKAVEAVLTKNKRWMSTDEIWNVIKLKPPRAHKFHDDDYKKHRWIEGPNAYYDQKYERFGVICSMKRKELGLKRPKAKAKKK